MGGFTRPDARYQRLGIGLPRKLDELGPQVLLKGPPGQGGAGSELVAGLVGNVPDCDGHTHSITMQLMLLICNLLDWVPVRVVQCGTCIRPAISGPASAHRRRHGPDRLPSKMRKRPDGPYSRQGSW